MSSGRKGAKSPRSAMSILLSSGLLNGLSSSVHGTEKATAVSSSKEKKSKALHSGYLLKLSGKTVLSGGNWKRRFFVLEKRRLVYYESEEVWRSGARASGFVSLEFYDVCEEKQTRKATNVFFVGAGDKNLFEPTRHFFSAETLPEMTAWMSHIRSALKEARKSQRVSSKAPPETKKNEEKRREIEKDTHKKVTELRYPMEIRPEPSLEHLMISRPRGPAGKRPPTNHRVTLLRDDMRSKSNSLTTLEVNPKEERLATLLDEAEEFDQALFVNYDGMKQACNRTDSVYHSLACDPVDSIPSLEPELKVESPVLPAQSVRDRQSVSQIRKFFGWLQNVFREAVRPVSFPHLKFTSGGKRESTDNCGLVKVKPGETL